MCITAYVSTQCLGISLHQFPFGWLAFAGTLNLLTHFTHHLSDLYIFVFVNNHINLHLHHVRQLLLLFEHEWNASFSKMFSRLPSKSVRRRATLPLEVLERNKFAAEFYHLKWKIWFFTVFHVFSLQMRMTGWSWVSFWCRWKPHYRFSNS